MKHNLIETVATVHAQSQRKSRAIHSIKIDEIVMAIYLLDKNKITRSEGKKNVPLLEHRNWKECKMQLLAQSQVKQVFGQGVYSL